MKEKINIKGKPGKVLGSREKLLWVRINWVSWIRN